MHITFFILWCVYNNFWLYHFWCLAIYFVFLPGNLMFKCLDKGMYKIYKENRVLTHIIAIR